MRVGYGGGGGGQVRPVQRLETDIQGQVGESLTHNINIHLHPSKQRSGWKRRSARCRSVDETLTHNITCQHGGLLPERAGARARRVAVPADIFRYFEVRRRLVRVFGYFMSIRNNALVCQLGGNQLG